MFHETQVRVVVEVVLGGCGPSLMLVGEVDEVLDGPEGSLELEEPESRGSPTACWRPMPAISLSGSSASVICWSGAGDEDDVVVGGVGRHSSLLMLSPILRS